MGIDVAGHVLSVLREVLCVDCISMSCVGGMVVAMWWIQQVFLNTAVYSEHFLTGGWLSCSFNLACDLCWFQRKCLYTFAFDYRKDKLTLLWNVVIILVCVTMRGHNHSCECDSAGVVIISVCVTMQGSLYRVTVTLAVYWRRQIRHWQTLFICCTTNRRRYGRWVLGI